MTTLLLAAPAPAADAGWLEQLRAIVGAAHVRADEATLARYARSTAARSTRPLVVVAPGAQHEVQAVVRFAARVGLAIYPVSTGKNWGYGDACAIGSGHLLLDLSRMNRIISVDAELAYAVIEPGVTQQQLSDHLCEQGLPLWMDCTGAGPDTSLMGNILERGFGHSPYGNRLQHVSGMRVVLASGEVLDTGFGHYPNAQATHVFPYGVGPFIDGMFTQSNVGIVLQIGMWLMPKSACLNHFLCSVPRHEDIARVVDALRPLRLDGTLRSIVHIGNDLRVLSGGMTFPRDMAGEHGCLPDAVRAALRSDAGIGAWTVSGALHGSAGQLAVARKAIRGALRGRGATVRFLDERKLDLADVAGRCLGRTRVGARLRAQVAMGRSLFAMNRGIPDGRFLAGAYWRRQGGLPGTFPRGADPAQDGCGMLWLSPVLPMRGRDLLAVHDLAAPAFREHGFDLFATFSMINERALGGVLTVAYDQGSAEETARAHRCYRALFTRLMAAGYIPYRVGNQSMGDLDPHGDVYWNTVAKIKAALDPGNVIAPGRYQPGEVARAEHGPNPCAFGFDQTRPGVGS